MTPDTLRTLGFRTLRRLAQPGNGVLDAEEQRQFDIALEEVKRSTTARLNESLERASRDRPANLDPELRRSYLRTQQRLAARAEAVRRQFPELALDERATEPAPTEPAPTDTDDAHTDISPDALEADVEQTSDTLDMLERIASLQQQQLEHQKNQLLTDTRGLFFAFLVSVTVIIAGVAPLVEAEPHDRWLILLWTAVAVALAGLVYALVRAIQRREK